MSDLRAILTGPTFTCPVDGCEFTHTPTPLAVEDTTPLDAVFALAPGAFARQAEHQWREGIERELAAHLDRHTSVEWLTTIVRLRARLGDPILT